MRWLRCAGCLAGLTCLAATCYAIDTSTSPRSHPQKKIVTLSPWEQAERGRDALEAIPEDTRTRADYAHAMDAYRAIYHANPRDGHAPAAINAVAEMLAEQGRSLHDPKSLQGAMGQYEFLRTQYPGSSLCVQALLAQAQIEQNDLGDATAAKEKYKLLLKEHPKSEQAEEARAGLASLQQGAPKPAQTIVAETHVPTTKHNAPASAATVDTPGHSSLPATPQTSGTRGTMAAPSSAAAAARTGISVPTDGVDVEAVDAQTRPEGDAQGVKRSGSKALVTGIRHWSTATYTRVAIDLGDNVTYEAARVPNPDRIYFDLHGTRLAQELVGKSFAVTDDGFLKKIRAAQFSDDMTRVVLDVSDVSEYSAFLLPNPYRLIIDIHGGQGGQGSAIKGQGPAAKDGSAAPAISDVPAPRVAATVKPTAAKPVPNTVATKSANTSSDVADLSEMPGRVEATKKPTSKPISAVVEAETKDQAVEAATNAAPDSGAGVASPDNSKKTRKSKAGAKVADATPARAAVPTADGETSLVRALGLKIGRIVIDAGHGGHDSGTLGVDGIEEKDVVLDVALRLGKLLHDRLGAEIIYTRSDDTFVPLETRTAIANKAQADLFLSIHANSSSDETARGVETYYLNFTSDPTALDVAARENAVSDQSIHQLSDLVKKIALKDKIEESREFAADVEQGLYGGLQRGNTGLKDRGVKKAPFVVLIGANMPSILAEISFVTNAKDAGQLREPEYRQRVAESLYKGVARYEGGLSGTRVPVERAAAGQ
jgi:N-acetylmuramoyl-L-alanine amidase